MAPEIAVAYYPEGAGHATRMLSVAEALRADGADVYLAGGGDGARFTELHGYEQFEPTDVDFIETYQHGSVLSTLTESFPKAVRRTADFLSWFRAESFDAVVTDDMFAVKAAAAAGLPLYVIKHDVPGMYDDPLQRAGAAFHVGLQRRVARRFFYPSVWPPSRMADSRVTHIPPIALSDGGRSLRIASAVLVPSHYSSGFDEIAERLEAVGVDTVVVGDDEWDAVPVLLPYLRGADTVICSGYSTVMEAAVAGTPCVVRPETDEQEGVCRWLERTGAEGFEVVRNLDTLIETAVDPPAEPSFENGAPLVAERVLADLDSGTSDVACDAPVEVAPGVQLPSEASTGD